MTSKIPVSTIVPFGLRLQPDLKARLEEEAKKNNRSLNAEIADRLERSFNLSVSFHTPEEAAAHAVKVFEEEFRKGVNKALRDRLGETWIDVAADHSDVSQTSPPHPPGESEPSHPAKKPRRKLGV